MLLTFYIVQALRAVAGLVFLYQCTVFVFYFGQGLLRGENGITRGLLVLYASLMVSGISAVMDSAAFSLDLFWGLAFVPDPSPYVLATSTIRLIFLVTGCAGNHLLYFALRKANP